MRTEVETFRTKRPSRPVIPVCLDACFRDKALSDAVHPWLKHAESIWLDEQSESAARGLATDALVTRLLIAPNRLKANTLWRTVVSAVGLCLAVLAAVAAWQAVAAMRERDRVSALRDQTLSRQLAAQSAASIVLDPVRALLLAVQSQAIARSPASDGALLGAISSLPVTRFQQHGAAFETLAVSPSGEAMVVSDVRGAVFQAELNKPALKTVVPPKEGINLYGAVNAIAFAPDGKRGPMPGPAVRSLCMPAMATAAFLMATRSASRRRAMFSAWRSARMVLPSLLYRAAGLCASMIWPTAVRACCWTRLSIWCPSPSALMAVGSQPVAIKAA